MTLEDLLQLIWVYSDVNIITNSNYSESEVVKLQFQLIVDIGSSLNGTNLLDPFIVQIYSEDILDVSQSI